MAGQPTRASATFPVARSCPPHHSRVASLLPAATFRRASAANIPVARSQAPGPVLGLVSTRACSTNDRAPIGGRRCLAARADCGQHRLLGRRPPRRRLARPVRRRRATAATADVDGAETLRWTGRDRSRASLGAAVALGSGSYLAANAQTAGGCSLMVWESDNRGRQRWCTRLVQGGDLSSPLFDGFDNLYVGQPGTMLSFPPTQWIRWRKPVIGLPMTPRILDPDQPVGGDAPRAGAGVRRAPRRRGRHVAGSRRGRRPHRFAARTADCAHGRSRCPVAAAPAFSPATGIIVVGAVGARRRGAVRRRPALPPRPDPTAVAGVDQHRRRWRPTRQPGAVGRRHDRLRQRPRPTPVGTEHRRRQAEVVGAPGLPAADPAVGVTRRADRGRRRTGRQARRASRTAAITATWRGRRDDVDAVVDVQPGRHDVAYTVARDGENGQAAAGVRPDRRPHAQHLSRCRAPPASPSGCRSATTAASSQPPATVRCTGSRRR